jgi:DNA replication protein DnaC
MCPVCKGIGWVYPDLPRNDPYFGKTVRCKCKAEEDRANKERALIAYCQLPPKGEDMTFSTFRCFPDMTDVYEAAKSVANDKLKWLILAATPGHGKTHLALAAVNEWLKRGRAARYVYVPLLLSELRQGMADDEYRKVLNRFLTVPLLVLDDLGVEKPTEWVKEQLDTIINDRLMNKLSLIVTTNLSSGNTDERIVNRFKRACLDETFGRAFVLTGDDYSTRIEKIKGARNAK